MNLALNLTKFLILLPVLLYVTVWGALALWFQLPGPTLSVALTAGIFGFLGVSAIVSLFRAL